MSAVWLAFACGVMLVGLPIGLVIAGLLASGKAEDAYVRGVRDGRAWRTRMMEQHLSQRRPQ